MSITLEVEFEKSISTAPTTKNAIGIAPSVNGPPGTLIGCPGSVKAVVELPMTNVPMSIPLQSTAPSLIVMSNGNGLLTGVKFDAMLVKKSTKVEYSALALASRNSVPPPAFSTDVS